MRQFAKEVFNALASFKLVVVILLFMFLITWLGTLYQEQNGLFSAQKTYFDSWILLQTWVPMIGGAVELPRIGSFQLGVPLPGAYLLMALLSANILVGGLVRLRYSWSRVGVFITHVGIVLMLLAGFVKFHFAIEGGMQLYEGEQASEFVSFHYWEIAIQEPLADGRVREFLIPDDDLVDLAGRSDRMATFRSPELPFDLAVSHFMVNSAPARKGPMFAVDVPVVDGIYLKPLPRDAEQERNVAGCYVSALPADGGSSQQGVVWGLERHPFTVEAGGRRFGVTVRKKRYPLDFMIHLDKFNHEFHPGTSRPKLFRSDVTIVDGDSLQPVKIEMNAPLRREGVIVFQSNWGPSNARPGDRLYSGFSVVNNPSDQWPLYSCIVIAIGLIIHNVRLLVRYILRETESREAKAA